MVIALPRPHLPANTSGADSADIMTQIKMKRRSQLRAVVIDRKMARMSIEDKGGLANALMAALNARRLAVTDQEEGGEEGEGSEDEWSDE